MEYFLYVFFRLILKISNQIDQFRSKSMPTAGQKYVKERRLIKELREGSAIVHEHVFTLSGANFSNKCQAAGAGYTFWVGPTQWLPFNQLQ